MIVRGTPALRAAARYTASLGKNRCLATAATEGAVEFDIHVPFKTHECDGPEHKVYATKDELLGYYKDMNVIRRMEIACDNEYKARNIRGFCHLYDGQEAVCTGVEAGVTRDDDWITSYRCHGVAYARGCTVEEIMAEQFGYSNGVVKGKGGSMHLYKKDSNFWGGAAIVGAQVPIGVGIGFANKYAAEEGEAMNVSMSFYGDGAANQGQCWEAANMAQLWKIPALFVIENNEYGMGTSTARSSALTEYYKQGNIIPGIQCDGMDVLAVRECFRYAKEWSGSGKGPMFIEIKTYRYHGHSMSDPGLSYRDREEVQNVRASRDCIAGLKDRIIDAGFATEEELKQIEKDARKHVTAEVKKAKKGKELPLHEIYTDIYHEEIPEFIRGAEMATSAYNGKSTM
eukprot:g1571.t1